MSQLLIAVVNYDFNRNATLLKRVLGKHADTILIDSSSPQPPVGVDLIVPNTYYPGLWNAAIAKALEHGYEWVWVIASDVQLRMYSELGRCLKEVITNSKVGVWTPSVHKSSRCASKLSFTRNSNGLRTCSYVEGFCFMVRTHVIAQQYPLPDWNRSGWGVDVVTSWLARNAGYKVQVDDRVLVYHPRAKHSHRIAHDPAHADLVRYCTEFGIDDDERERFFYSDYEQLKAEGLME